MVPVDGGEVWADDSGGDLPPLVLLHPGVGDSRIWEPVLPGLRDHFRILRYDVRGYGHSPAPTGPYSTVADLVAVLDHFGLDRVPVAGTSMGGGTAIDLALAHPERLTSVVALCPGISGYPWPRQEGEEQIEASLAAGDLEAVVEQCMRIWGAAGRTDEVAAQLRSAVKAWPDEARYLRPEPPAFDRLEEVTVPTMFACGDRDTPPVIDCNRRAAERIPGARLIWLPGVDHFPTLREPERIAAIIREHCSR
jgi:pimeloyl-ACP methyl ester carboxylesterase